VIFVELWTGSNIIFKKTWIPSLSWRILGQLFKLCRRQRTTHSFESGVLEQGNMENMQGGVPWGPGLRNTAVHYRCSPFAWWWACEQWHKPMWKRSLSSQNYPGILCDLSEHYTSWSLAVFGLATTLRPRAFAHSLFDCELVDFKLFGDSFVTFFTLMSNIPGNANVWNTHKTTL